MAEEETPKKEKVVKEKKEKTGLVILKVAEKGAKDRKELADKVVEYFTSKGTTTNSRGFEITKKHVLQQISALFKDVTSGKKAICKIYKIEENEETGALKAIKL